MRLAFLIVMLWFSTTAYAREEPVQSQIDRVFSNIEEAAYSPASLLKAQSELHAIKHPSALTAAIIIAQYENMSPILTKGLLVQLGETAKTYELSNGTGLPDTNVDAFVLKYDGLNSSLAEALFWISGRERLHRINWQGSPHFTVPCHYFMRHPDIGQFTKFLGRHWHRSARPMLDIGCFGDQGSIEAMSNVYNLWTMGRGVAYRHPLCGTIYRDHAAGRRFTLYKSLYRPSEIEIRNPNTGEDIKPLDSLRETGFFDWALTGRQNYESFLELENLFLAARPEMIAYYQTQFGYSYEEADKRVPYAFLQQMNGRRVPFSRAMDASLTGTRKIRADILSGQNISAEDYQSFKDDAPVALGKWIVSKAGIPEPLLHLAIGNDHILKQMIAAGYDIEVRDAIGKTPLMVAAQDDNFTAVQTLLKAGADVNAISFHPKDIAGNSETAHRSYCMPYDVKTGERTALNYAISEASADVVNVLIESGAELTTVDSSGFTLGDYFDGNGPTVKNTKLPANMRNHLPR